VPEVDIHIGGRTFQVACQEGEEHFLQSAAAMLDHEAQTLSSSLGRIPEARMLLMAGLMLADRTAGLEEEVRNLEARLAEAASTPQPAASSEPEQVEVRVEVPVEVEVVPNHVVAALSDLADRAEAVAEAMEVKLAS